jgi:2-keto-4-pentenoate hydratase/2-oxohepta-3-ene-1,7-dioic acid hydratase in catechol pathway
MKVVNVMKKGGGARLGFLKGDSVIDALAASKALGVGRAAWFKDTVSFIKSGEEGLAAAKKLIAGAPQTAVTRRSQLKLAAPIIPSTILASGSNYIEHNQEKANLPISGKEVEFFIMTGDCVIGTDEPIVYEPKLTRKLDVETELAVIIGKPGRHIPKEKALEHVFGYTVVNDVSARDLQVRKSKEGFVWYETGRGKAFDSSAPLGPCIVTADEIGDPQTLDLKTRVNGELRQSTNTRNMIFTCADIIHHFSISFTLKPGMVIITGTPGGTAWSADPELGGKWQNYPGLVRAGRYCLPGDIVESEIEKIGILRNEIVHA